MKRGLKSSLTVALSLTLLSFLSLCMVLVESVRVHYFQLEAEKAADLSGFAVLSEYQQELFAHYGLFFLELDYEQGKENTAILLGRMQKYLTENAPELENWKLGLTNFQRATDGNGSAVFAQAVNYMKETKGISAVEEALGVRVETLALPESSLSELAGETFEKVSAEIDSIRDEEGHRKYHLSLPDVSIPGGALLIRKIFGTEDELSKKSISRESTIRNRSLVIGGGQEEEKSFADMQIYHWYLRKHLACFLTEDERIPREALEYQLEYVIAGKTSDRENLEEIASRIFLLRATGNYLLFHEDSGRMARAESTAAAIAGITGSPHIIAMVRELVLLSQAMEEGLSETKRLLLGERVPIYQDGAFVGFDMGYEDYLSLFLNFMTAENKILRSMDIMEQEVRHASGYEAFRLDHCADAFLMDWTYKFDSLFVEIPWMEGGKYKYRMIRKLYYER